MGSWENGRTEDLKLTVAVDLDHLPRFLDACRCVNSRAVRRTFETADGPREVICLSGTLLLVTVASEPSMHRASKVALTFCWRHGRKWNDGLVSPGTLNRALVEALGEGLPYPPLGISVPNLMQHLLWEGGKGNVTITLERRPDVETSVWWTIRWGDKGDFASATTLDLCLFRAAVLDFDWLLENYATLEVTLK